MIITQVKKAVIWGIGFGVVLVVFLGVASGKVEAAISGCSATVDLHEAEENQNFKPFAFTITNNDVSNSVVWFQVTRATSLMEIKGGALFGWVKAILPESLTFTGGNLAAGGNLPFTVYVNTNTSAAGNWVVQASDDAGGAGAVTCSGNLSLTVGNVDQTPPVIGGVSVNVTGQTIVVVNWTTDEAANSFVEYSPLSGEDEYLYSKTDATLTTSHSLTLDQYMAAGVTYYYKISSTDESGNKTTTEEYSYTTLEPDATPAPTAVPTTTPAATPVTVVITPAPTTAPTATPVPTPIPDTTAPTISIITQLSNPMSKVPKIEGFVSDNKIIDKVEYSLDSGKNWQLVGEGATPKAASGAFGLDLNLGDGKYELWFRATDNSGNKGEYRGLVLELDSRGPELEMEYDFSHPKKEVGEIKIKARDKNEIGKIWYSTDGLGNWIEIENFDQREVSGEKIVDWGFVPKISLDGNYHISLKAVDVAGNESVSREGELVIDRLPPRVGGYFMSVGPQVLYPDENGMVMISKDLEVDFATVSVGGASKVELQATINGSEPENFELGFDPELGLWLGSVNLKQVGEYELIVKAVDGADNRTTRKLGNIRVTPLGKVEEFVSKEGVSGAEIKVYVQEELSGEWLLWSGESFGQKNPVKVGEEGVYSLFLPAGKYYLEVNALGYKKSVSDIFEVEQVAPINKIIDLEKARGIKVWKWFLGFGGRSRIFEVELMKGEGVIAGDDRLGKKAADFDLLGTGGDRARLSELFGNKSLISMVTTWSPAAVEQIRVLDEIYGSNLLNGFMVASEESVVKLEMFKARGGYRSEFVVDVDGELVEPYGLGVLPTHYFLDEGGVIRQVRMGVLSGDEIEEIINSF